MEIVAGLTLKQLKPLVWDKDSEYFIPAVNAVMVSYADFHRVSKHRQQAMSLGLHSFLGIPKNVRIYLDKGAFYFLSHVGDTPRDEDEEFVQQAKPDWWPIPQDYIPIPKMSLDEQEHCFTRTMEVNLAYQRDGFVPVIHISRFLEQYTVKIQGNSELSKKPAIALGGIVPNLLRAPKAMTHTSILDSLRQVRQAFVGKQIHVFGIGGTATLHIAALLGIDSVDSSGWRNRAARGVIQLPGTGERVVAELGSWRGRRPTSDEWKRLEGCPCPACKQHGTTGLKANRSSGFYNRATHNLWMLLEEALLIQEHLAAGTYAEWYKGHLDNTMYRPLIEALLG